MMYITVFLGFCLVIGVASVASNPSPYYGVAGLVGSSLVGCCMLVVSGVSFLSLVLFMIYLGGMLVVFAYSVALASEPFPETWGSLGVLMYFVGGVSLVFILGLCSLEGFNFEGFGVVMADTSGLFMVRMDLCGSALLFSIGGGCLLVCGLSLLLVLFVVVEVVSGGYRGSLREI